jgi:hypothetical protein
MASNLSRIYDRIDSIAHNASRTGHAKEGIAVSGHGKCQVQLDVVVHVGREIIGEEGEVRF